MDRLHNATKLNQSAIFGGNSYLPAAITRTNRDQCSVCAISEYNAPKLTMVDTIKSGSNFIDLKIFLNIEPRYDF
ncbi:hypothetical protein EBAPG3_010155 [Nitrosospira lacus]|uniref:Uncharacterized protein n=1 Tax=Nitrosospira lacus TaxID=1288494 RepID=A0A1W6SQL1_9PROT|nr:hypothetical protein EBAPG3_010155 [Nitrosospira lacus]